MPLALLVLGGVLAPRCGEGFPAAAAQRRASPRALPISATPPPLSPLQSTPCGGVSPSGRRLPPPPVPPPLSLGGTGSARAKRGRLRGSTAARGVSRHSRQRVRLPSMLDRDLLVLALCLTLSDAVPRCTACRRAASTAASSCPTSDLATPAWRSGATNTALLAT